MRNVVLRTATHHLVMAFRCPLVDCFMAGPAEAAPDAVTWGTRTFVFSTMDEDNIIYSEGFVFALIEGVTANQLPPEEMAKIDALSPVV